MRKRGFNGHPVFKSNLTFGQRASDKLTRWAGSWTFILSLMVIMLFWMLANVYLIFYRWDPYPFILLNFVLSTLAAMQAPIILMSQNRAAERDRLFSKYDHRINMKAEREIQNIQSDLEEIKKILKRKRK